MNLFYFFSCFTSSVQVDMKDASAEYVPYFCPSCDFESESHNILLRHRLWAHDFGFKEHDNLLQNHGKDYDNLLAETNRAYKLLENNKCVENQEKGMAEVIQSKIKEGIENILDHNYDQYNDDEIDFGEVFDTESTLDNIETNVTECITEPTKREYIEEFDKKNETEEDRFDRDLLEQEYQRRTVQCSLCPKTYNSLYSKMSLSKHMKCKHSSVTHICDTCGKGFQHTSYLKQHSNTHIDLKCDKCDYTALKRESLNNHITLTHLGLTFNCNECNKSYSNSMRLKQHISKTHKGPDSIYDCNQCNKSHSNSKCLKHSIRKNHLGREVVYDCKICGSIKKSRRSLREHIGTKHEGKKRNRTQYFSCVECKRKIAKQYTSCIQHSCTECMNKSFIKAFTKCLDHNFICDKCGFVTRSNQILKTHKVSRSCNSLKAKKTYKCKKCHLCFTTEKYMEKHEQQHTEGKPFKCDNCEFSFTLLNSLKVHRKSVICKR